jgi:MinD-like ATPase involved in chromosome partitioning or flagellar assembly
VTVPVLTAVTDAVWEADLVAAFDRGDYGVSVVRRCVDLTELLSVAASGTARAVILSAQLRRLDRDALARLAAGGVAVVGVVAPGDEHAERRLRQLGVRHLLGADAGAQAISATVTAAVAEGMIGRSDLDYGDPAAGFAELPPGAGSGSDADPSVADLWAGADRDAARGRLVAVWGPTGAPGRTTVAVTLAAETAWLGCGTLLADADVYGGVIAQVLGLLDESPGLAAATRAANLGTLDLPALAKLARVVQPNLRVLTGIARPDRWPELRPAALTEVYAQARALATLTVVDCGFAIEQDEELSYDTAVPRRNGATLATLADADEVLAVGSADPVGLQRLIRALADLKEAIPDCRVQVVVNRVRKGPVNGDLKVQISQALSRYAGVEQATLVPYDRHGMDRAIADGRTLAEVAPDSAARLALLPVAARLAGVPVPNTGQRRRVRRRSS